MAVFSLKSLVTGRFGPNCPNLKMTEGASDDGRSAGASERERERGQPWATAGHTSGAPVIHGVLVIGEERREWKREWQGV